MKHIYIFAAVSAALCAAVSTGSGCGGGSTSSSSSSSSSSSGTGTGGVSAGSSSSSSSSSSSGSFPAPPTIGTQIDRMGRPAVNTALNNGFDADAGAAGSAKDAYNADSTPTDWAAKYTPQFETNLGIIDALDTVCGNQAGYTIGGSYALLAGALTDDQLYLNTAGTSGAYLGVELLALGGQPAGTQQGGRRLSDVVLDTTYSLLAIGKPTGVSNGITKNNVSFLTAFPYVAPPNAAPDGG